MHSSWEILFMCLPHLLPSPQLHSSPACWGYFPCCQKYHQGRECLEERNSRNATQKPVGGREDELNLWIHRQDFRAASRSGPSLPKRVLIKSHIWLFCNNRSLCSPTTVCCLDRHPALHSCYKERSLWRPSRMTLLVKTKCSSAEWLSFMFLCICPTHRFWMENTF